MVSGIAVLGEEGEGGFEGHRAEVAFGAADADRLVLDVLVAQDQKGYVMSTVTRKASST